MVDDESKEATPTSESENTFSEEEQRKSSTVLDNLERIAGQRKNLITVIGVIIIPIFGIAAYLLIPQGYFSKFLENILKTTVVEPDDKDGGNKAGPLKKKYEMLKVKLLGSDLEFDENIKELLKSAQSIEENGDKIGAAETLRSLGILLSRRMLHRNALKAYEVAIQLNPINTKSYYHRGISKAALGKYKAAIEDYKEAHRLNPDDAELIFDYAKAYNNWGNKKAAQGEHTAAIKDYDKALELKSNYAKAYYHRGRAKAALGKYKAAIEDYKEAHRVNPGHAELISDYAKAYKNWGNEKASQGEHTAAIKDYDKALELNSKYSKAYYHRGRAKAALKKYNDAHKDYMNAIKLNPDLTGLKSDLGNLKSYLSKYYFIEGIKQAYIGKHKAAIADFSRAISFRCDYPEAYLQRAYSRAAIGKKIQSAEDFRMATNLGRKVPNSCNEKSASLVEKQLNKLDDQ